MNPSTAEILEAIEYLLGKDVVILPNNTNIYPVAAQACELSSKPAYVVATAGVQEAFAALLDYDPQAAGDANAEAMSASAGRVVFGEVTQAVRATTTDTGPSSPVTSSVFRAPASSPIGKNLAEATTALLERLITDDHEIVTLIEGADVPASELRSITEWLDTNHPDISVERLQGGQPLYPFLLSIE